MKMSKMRMPPVFSIFELPPGADAATRKIPGESISTWWLLFSLSCPLPGFFTWNHLCPSISKNHDVQYHSLSWGAQNQRSCLWLSCGEGARQDGWIEHLSGFALDVWLITWFTLTSWAISPKIWLFLLLHSPWAGKTNWKVQKGSPCCLKIFNFLFHLSPSHNTVHFYNSRMKGCYVAVIGMLMMKGRPPVHCTKHSCSRSQRARAAHSLKFEAARSKLGKSGSMLT